MSFGNPPNDEAVTNSFQFRPMQSNTDSERYLPSGRIGLPHLDWKQQQQTIPSIDMHNQTPIADLSLGQLLVLSPTVQGLHENLNEAYERISQAIETQAVLIKENLRLSSELREFRELAASRRFDS